MPLVAGCSSTAPTPATNVAAGAVEKQVPRASITVAPPAGSTAVPLDATVQVDADKGRLTTVTVTDHRSRPLAGQVSADGSSWTATGSLRLASSYIVKATAVDAKGLETTTSSSFVTVKPSARLETSISPLSGSTVGVGMPIIVRLSKPAKDRAAVERRLTIDSSKAIDGSWSWVGDEEVHFRPRHYWPAYTDVTLRVRLRDVHVGKGVYGGKNRTIKFSTGASMVTVINVKKHRATIHRNGKVARTVPVSTGKAGFLTRGGTKVVLEKHRLKVMDAATIGIGRNDPEYYRLDVPYAMRVTWSGEFVHAAPWSTASQGRENVSHGCVGMSTSNAIWLFNQTNIGDVVRVVGSPRTLEPGNGYTDWNVSWADWVAGSAL
ncbi:MAG: L,D-transpeptidase [Actinomycetes bacterium]